MTAFTEAEIAALIAGAARRGLFVRIATASPLRYWLGVGNIAPGLNRLDPITGAKYSGAGQILDLPTFAAATDGSAERLAFAISGVPPTALEDLAATLSEQQAAIVGKDVDVGYCLMDYDWQLLGPVRFPWSGKADYIRVSRPLVTQVNDPELWTIELSVSSTFTGRRRPRHSYFVHADQIERSPGDLFCERTPLYSVDAEKRWPDFPT